MKKLITIAALALGFTAFAPQAMADQFIRQFAGYDRCGNPVYRTVRVCEPEYRPVYRDHGYRGDYGYQRPIPPPVPYCPPPVPYCPPSPPRHPGGYGISFHFSR